MARRDMDRGMDHGGDDRYRLMTEDEIQQALKGGVQIVREEEFLEERPWRALAGEGQRVIGRMVGKRRWFSRDWGFEMSP